MILDLYHPGRLKAPQIKGVEADWAAVEALIQERFKEGHSQGQGLAVLAQSMPSPSFIALQTRFRRRYPKALWCCFEPIGEENQRAGLKAAFGSPLRASYRLDKAERILSLDADFLGLEGALLAQSAQWAKLRSRRGASKDQMSRLYIAEGRLSLTGVQADHRLSLRADRVERLAWGLTLLAHRRGARLPPQISAAAEAMGEEGLKKSELSWLQGVVNDLFVLQGLGRRALIIPGRRQPPVVHHLAAALNRSLSAVGQAVHYFRDIRRPAWSQGGFKGLRDLRGRLLSGEIKTLILMGGDPLLDAPGDLPMREALERVELLIQLADYPSPSTPLADLLIPHAHFLESWGDWVDVRGTVAFQQPLIAPLYGAWNEHELLARICLNEVQGSHQIVRGFWKERSGRKGFHEKWRRWLHDGLIKERPFYGAQRSFKRVQGVEPPPPLPQLAEGLLLEFCEDHHLYDGRFAQNPWLQEAPDPLSGICWGNAAQLSPELAKRLGIKAEEELQLSLGGRKLQIPAWVQPGMDPETLLLSLGGGRDLLHPPPYSDLKRTGVNVSPLRSAEAPDFQAGLNLRGLGQQGVLYRLQAHHTGLELKSLTLQRTLRLEASPKAPRYDLHTAPKPSSSSAWGMLIDLSLCTGCQSCLLACALENNLPTVGPELLSQGRDLHWIQICPQRSEEPGRSILGFQPQLCQHCERAPCEQHCPVQATQRSPEGLNSMIYPRCLGAQACIQQCPFELRRFNTKDHRPKKGEGRFSLMQRNPNVSLRPQGVAEKCSLCIQRIHAGEREARRSQNPQAALNAVQSACSLACPTRALIFGELRSLAPSINQPERYQLLPERDLRPGISHLIRVINPNPEMDG